MTVGAIDATAWAGLVDRVVHAKRAAVQRLAVFAGAGLRGERARLDAILDAARVPDRCGPEIIPAPGRGPMIAFEPLGVMPKGRDEWEVQHVGYRGRDAVRQADAFDLMEAQARRACRKGQAFAPPFTAAQIEMARHYRTLTERHDAGGVRCVSLETVGRSSGGSSGEFIDAFVDEGRRLDALHRRIGTGVAMAVRRVRPSARGRATATIITDRHLVDAVCLGDKTLSDVLKANGWAAKGDHRDRLRLALGAALDRMRGV